MSSFRNGQKTINVRLEHLERDVALIASRQWVIWGIVSGLQALNIALNYILNR